MERRRDRSRLGLVPFGLVACLTLAGAPVFAQVAGGVTGALPATLVPALQQMKAELALSDEQTTEAGRLLSDRMSRASMAVENFGGISFDSVLDLLVEARSFRDEFIPDLSALLTDDQKKKLASLPKSHEIYVSAMAGWFAEARLGKLATRLKLSDTQVPQVRTFLTDEFRDAAGIIEGLVKKDAERPAKSAILDAVVDLRSIQRQSQRNLERILSPEQKSSLEAYRRESEKKSETADDQKK